MQLPESEILQSKGEYSRADQRSSGCRGKRAFQRMAPPAIGGSKSRGLFKIGQSLASKGPRFSAMQISKLVCGNPWAADNQV